MHVICEVSLRSFVSYLVDYFLSLLLFFRGQLQLGAQSVVYLWGQNLRDENEQTISGTGDLLMIFHHKNHITFSKLALRFCLFRSDKVECDENDRLESPFQINAKFDCTSYKKNFFVLTNICWNRDGAIFICFLQTFSWSFNWF